MPLIQPEFKPTQTPHEPTKWVRVPVSMVDVIRHFAACRGLVFPCFDESVQAGFPSPAEGDNSFPLDIAARLVPHPENVRFIRAADESMIKAGIFPDDLLIADHSIPAQSGDVIACFWEGEILVRRLYISRRQIELRPENPLYSRLSLSPETELEVIGVIRNTVHTLYGKSYFDR